MSRQLIIKKGEKSIIGRIPVEMLELIHRVRKNNLKESKGVDESNNVKAQQYIAKEFTEFVQKLEEFKRNSE